MDIAQIGVTVGAVVATALVNHKVITSVHGEQIITLFKRADANDSRHAKTEERLNNLHTEFVPRTELTERINTVSETQKRIEQKVDYLIMGKRPELPK